MVQILVLDDYLTSSCLKYQWCALVHLASPECSRLLGLVLLDSVNSLPPSACIPHTLSGHTENRNDNATLELARRAVRASVVILRCVFLFSLRWFPSPRHLAALRFKSCTGHCSKNTRRKIERDA